MRARKLYPKGRGVFFNEFKTFQVWVNEQDHLKIISVALGSNIYERLVNGVNQLEQVLSFHRSEKLGYLTLCPTNLGTTLRASVLIKLPNLGRNPRLLAELCKRYSLQMRGTLGEHSAVKDTTFDLSNKVRMGLTEYEALKVMCDGVTKVIKHEMTFQKPQHFTA
ncbi:unnamed protein product [Darwinula stevensoni]|uniref:arginine kinase n=1 Tax=Darwinula stevensoni TaxID=69355 RepID=A0A7R9A643_9CRUS|nr:unnamed protein product [Darwinula stevensoni]CAG0895897.1 unnamed protein product [Darwinula stevensoni]